MIQTIISDMGNVVLLFDHMIFIRKVAAFTAHSPKKVLSILQDNIELIKNFSRGQLEPEAYVEEMTNLIQAEVEKNDFVSMYRDIFSLNRDALNTLREWKDTKQLVLLSNTDFIHFEYIKKKFPEMFIFDEYVLSYETGTLKPEIDIYKIALGRSGISPGEAVFIDDLKANVDAAARLGMQGIVYCEGLNLRAELDRLINPPGA